MRTWRVEWATKTMLGWVTHVDIVEATTERLARKEGMARAKLQDGSHIRVKSVYEIVKGGPRG